MFILKLKVTSSRNFFLKLVIFIKFDVDTIEIVEIMAARTLENV